MTTHQQEIEMQAHKVAGLERFIAQMDLELRLHDEMRLIVEKSKREFTKRLKQEREYLDWLNDSTEHPDAEPADPGDDPDPRQAP